MSDKSIQAKSMMMGGFNCAQSVLSAFAPELAFGKKDALRVAGAFGGGMGRMGKTCGAVAGAFITIGLVSSKTAEGEDGEREVGYALVQEFTELFEARHGTVECQALLGANIGTEEGMAFAKANALFSTKCVQYVEDAVTILEEILP